MIESSDRKNRIELGREQPRRLLLPIDATERSQGPLRYALERRSEVEHVDLLAVAERIIYPQMLRFRTQAELSELQNEAAVWLLEHAAKPLQDAGLRVARHFREGNIVAEILEAAEQLGSDAIVLPAPRPLWMNLLGRSVVREVLRRPRATAIVLVSKEGVPIAAEPSAALKHAI